MRVTVESHEKEWDSSVSSDLDGKRDDISLVPRNKLIIIVSKVRGGTTSPFRYMMVSMPADLDFLRIISNHIIAVLAAAYSVDA